MNFIVLISAILIAFVTSEKIYIDNIPRIKSDIDLNLNDTSEIQPRIIGGTPARPGQFPYQVGLDINNLDSPNNNEYRSWCGGSLISINYVLTAAHCVYMPVHYQLPDGSAYPNPNVYDIVPSIDVYLGLVNQNYLDGNVQKINVPRMNIVIHYAYNRFVIQNDIALLRLTQPAQLNGFVQLINLPKWSHDQNDLLTTSVTSSGWGIYTGNEPSTILRYAEFGVVPHQQCVLFYNNIINEKQMCIYKPRKSGCMGDSGGPNAVTETNGQKTVYGITSFISMYGCESGYPTVLTRVSGYLDWIQQHSDIHIS